MKIEKKIIDRLHHSNINDTSNLHINNCIINEADFIGFESKVEVIIENSIINHLLIHTAWFRDGFIFRGNHVLSYIDCQMGGHNLKPIIYSNNIFHEFYNFFDCQFTEELIVKNNIFLKGSNLMGNVNEGWRNAFEKEPIFEGNIGLLDLDGMGEI